MIRPLVAAFVIALATGCHSVDPVPPLPPPRGGTGAKLVLGETLVAYEPSTDMKKLPRPALDVGALEQRVGDVLRERGVFTGLDVASVDSRAPAPAARQNFSERLERAGKVARQSGAKWLAVIDVQDSTARYVGQTPTFLFVVKVLILVGSLPFPDIPNYVLSTDQFEVTYRAKVTLLDAGSGAQVGEKLVAGNGKGVFGDFSRGWYYYGFVRVPGCLDQESWDDILKELRPPAQEGLARECAKAIEELALEKKP